MPQVHLDTIPILDAFALDSECPLCALERKMEAQFVDIALGGAMMEPDTRIATNKEGFCGKHFAQMFAMQQKLPLALMTHTHLRDVMTSLDDHEKELIKAMEQEKKKNGLQKAAGSVTKNSPLYKQVEALADHLEGRMSSCYICGRMEKTMERYLETLCYLYKKDSSFKATFKASKGFCVHHFAPLLRAGEKYLSGDTLTDYLSDLLDVQNHNLSRTEHDLEWFTLKFNYQNQDKPWGESKDAVERTLNKLQGNVIVSEDK